MTELLTEQSLSNREINVITVDAGDAIRGENIGLHDEGEGRIKINTVEPEKECGHACHKGGILGFFWSIAEFFIHLFNIDSICECGETH